MRARHTRYAVIWVSIWNDCKFQRLSVYGKLLFIFLLSSQHQTMLGLLPLNKAALAAVCGLPKSRFNASFQELLENELIAYDAAGLVFVRHFHRHNPPANPNVAKKWGSLVGLFPECPLLQEAIESARVTCRQRGVQYLEAFEQACRNMENGFQNHTETVASTIREISSRSNNNSSHHQQQAEDCRMPFPYPVLPDTWRVRCQTLRPEVNAEQLFEKMRLYFVVGEKRGEECSQTEWSRRWEIWVMQERFSTSLSATVSADSYAMGIENDGSF